MSKSDFLGVLNHELFGIYFPQDGPLNMEQDILWNLADITLKYGFSEEDRIEYSFFGLEVSLDRSEGWYELEVTRNGWREWCLENDPGSLIGASFVFILENDMQVCWQRDLLVQEVKEAISIFTLFTNLAGFVREGERLLLLDDLWPIKVADVIQGMNNISQEGLLIMPTHLDSKAILSMFDQPDKFSIVQIGNMSVLYLFPGPQPSNAVIKKGIAESMCLYSNAIRMPIIQPLEAG